MNSIKPIILAVALIAAFAAAIVPLAAHHSHAMFNGSIETEITGVVTGLRFVNPHVYLQVKATHRDGKPLEPNETWAIEMSTTQNQISRGLGKDAIPVGATISVKVNPLFSGGHSGNYTNVVMINGVKNASTDQNWKPAS
jgi:hypothetical protein